MTDSEKMSFVWAKIREGKTKKQASQELSKQIRLDSRDNNGGTPMTPRYATPTFEAKIGHSILS